MDELERKQEIKAGEFMIGEVLPGPYDTALQHYHLAVQGLNLDHQLHERLKKPTVSCTSHVSTRMDDGSTKVFTGYRVLHNTFFGPFATGLMYHPSVNLGQVAASAMWNTWKLALLGLPLGGGFMGIECDPRRLSTNEMYSLTRRYVQQIFPNDDGRAEQASVDVLCPDVGTDERVMAWVLDTARERESRIKVTGRSARRGNGWREAVAKGLAYVVRLAAERSGLNVEETTMVVQGIDNLALSVPAELARLGIKFVGLSDRSGAVFNENGLPIDEAILHTARNGQLADFSHGSRMTAEKLMLAKCDMLVVASMREISGKTAEKLNCRILVEGPHTTATPAADEILWTNKVLVIPEILANTGGAISSYFEWVQDQRGVQWSEEHLDRRLLELVGRLFHEVASRSQVWAVPLRMAGLMIALRRFTSPSQLLETV